MANFDFSHRSGRSRTGLSRPGLRPGPSRTCPSRTPLRRNQLRWTYKISRFFVSSSDPLVMFSSITEVLSENCGWSLRVCITEKVVTTHKFGVLWISCETTGPPLKLRIGHDHVCLCLCVCYVCAVCVCLSAVCVC